MKFSLIYIFVKEVILLQESNFNVKRQTNIKSSIILTMLSKECSQRWEKNNNSAHQTTTNFINKS